MIKVSICSSEHPPTRVLSGFSELRKLDLSNCGLQILPPVLSGLTTLEELDLDGNQQLQAEDCGMERLAALSRLCSLSLAHCGLRDGVVGIGQFCIDQQLGHAMEGDTNKGLFFRGAGNLPFGREIRSVHDLLQWMLADVRPSVPSH